MKMKIVLMVKKIVFLYIKVNVYHDKQEMSLKRKSVSILIK